MTYLHDCLTDDAMLHRAAPLCHSYHPPWRDSMAKADESASVRYCRKAPGSWVGTSHVSVVRSMIAARCFAIGMGSHWSAMAPATC